MSHKFRSHLWPELLEEFGVMEPPLDDEEQARLRRREEREERRQQEAAEEEARWQQLWASGEMKMEEEDFSTEEEGTEEEQFAEDWSGMMDTPVEGRDEEKSHHWVPVGVNKVMFAGVMVDRELVVGAGLEETDEEELVALGVSLLEIAFPELGDYQDLFGDEATEG